MTAIEKRASTDVMLWKPHPSIPTSPLVDAEPLADDLISDERIRKLLGLFGPLLHRAISEGGSFFSVGVGGKLQDAVEGTDEELEIWDNEFGILDKVLAHTRQGNLYVADVPPFDDRVLINPDLRDRLNAVAPYGREARDSNVYRVNLEQTIWAPLARFDPEGMRIFIEPQVHFGGYLSTPGRLYNAFIAFDLKVKDRFGRWAVSHIPGTGNVYGSKPVYSPFHAARSSTWFNTRVDPEINNILTARGPFPDGSFMGRCEIHRLDEIGGLEIPEDSKLRVFFWQLNRFMNDSLFEVPLATLPQGHKELESVNKS